MQIVQILITDDEPHILRTFSGLLQNHIKDVELEIFTASSATKALSIMHAHRIDVLLTDIRMPMIDGLSLVRIASSLWPECKIIVMTAYDDFDVAKEVVNAGCSGILSKSDSDEVIVDLIQKTISSYLLSCKNKYMPILNTSTSRISNDRRLSLFNILKNETNTESALLPELQNYGFTRMPDYFIDIHVKNDMNILQSLALKHLRIHDNTSAVFVTENQLVAFLECNETLSVSIVLEVLEHLLFVFSEATDTQAIASFCSLEGIASCRFYKECENFLQQPTEWGIVHRIDSDPSFYSVHQNDMVNIIASYIKKNLSTDLSLSTLAKNVGYNASYLSRMFKNCTGCTLTEYINNLRFKEIKKLMRISSISMNEIMLRVGIESRSYFNRFIKERTGLSPNSLRESLQNNK